VGPGTALQIVVGGEAGQGLVTIGQLLAKVLVRCGYAIVVTQDYQSRIRGGHNSFRVRTAPGVLEAPQEAIDLLVALDPLTVALHGGELSERGLVLLDRRWTGPEGRCLPIPYQELAEERHWNTTALGIVLALLGLPEQQAARAVMDFFGPKKPQAAEANRQALEKAFSWTRDQHPSFSPLAPPGAEGPPRLLLNGNEAVALGALAGGLKFFAFYPMSPSTSIGLTLAGQASSLGIIVEQAEDEIAVINMALGASFAGATSMVATSGGGLALMTEGVSLAGMTETPLVIVVCQRPGPATGLPTRTEQGDLDLVLHAGHGEFPRAVFAPGSVEDCFHLTRRALETAERSQGPVFLLTDQFLADSYRGVVPFDLSPPSRRPDRTEIAPGAYLRYALTEDGVSPRLFPGTTNALVVADSDEHTEDGHLTEDLTVRKKMVEKRLKKLELLLDRVIPPESTGPDRPGLLLVTWGSSRGAVLEAAEILRSRGRSAGVLHFSQVWPLRPDQFSAQLAAAGEVVTIESNAFGQFARLLRRETGFQVSRQIRRYDGWPITPEYILRELERS
jgi:2-oxoglutarate ferredoxin oxidoreductase subunit alpha